MHGADRTATGSDGVSLPRDWRLTLGRLDEARADLDEAIRRSPTSAMFVNRGNVWHALQRYRDAADDFTKAIELDPQNALAFNNRGRALAELGNHRQALEDATQAIKLDPTFAEAYNNRGVSHRQLGEWDQAIADYTSAIEQYAGYAAAYANRGFARKQRGEYKDALVDYHQAIGLDPDVPQPYNDAAWLMATCPASEFRNAEEALEYAQRACDLTSNRNGDCLDTLAATQANVGDFERASETAARAITLLKGDARREASRRLEMYQSGQAFQEPAVPERPAE